ncbi:MAG: VapC toxin family PIN domain ribonuclease [Comamonadaceae bacterium CG_4_9_14_3_um_filter_60_33]|nr:MAG: VapC toxin family PIN domain ribonuclease [Comamonadaceae bacterium CG2_30_59_20]PJB43315.1 MAG: VapC toxin family PIN domain ribonuclease [Comamonadaceae bacterium CG_4_9_14_3_um_filter_60_33]
MRVALDTNILAYAEGLGDDLRCSTAMRLVEQLAGCEVVLPAQTLGELSRVLTGKAKRSASQAREAVLSWADTFDVADSTWFAFQAALDLTVDHQLPIWDALILAVAAENHCRLLLSEDFQNAFTWRGVTVVNPFVEPRSPLLAGLLSIPN